MADERDRRIVFIDDDPLFVDTIGRWQKAIGINASATTSKEE